VYRQAYFVLNIEDRVRTVCSVFGKHGIEQ
jgi:hypothetical protein